MFEYITKIQQFGGFIESLSDMSLQLMGFDIETTGLDCFEDKILLVQTKLGDKTFVFDIQKLGVKHSTYLIQLIKDSNKTLIGHNIKFDIKFIKFHFGELFENVYDTQIAENIITNGIAKDRYPSLSDLVLKYFKVFLDKTVRESFIGSEEITQDKLIYSAEDVNYLEGIYNLQVNKIRDQKQIPVLDLEMKLVPVVAQMELNGIKLDQEKWMELAKFAEQRVKELEVEIKEEMISRMNLSSYSSLRQLLDDYCITYKKTKKEAELLDQIPPEFAHDAIYERINPASNKQVTTFLQKCEYQVESSGREVLNDLYASTEDELILKLLEYRSFDKASGSFGENFLTNVHPLTGRIHSNFNQMGTRSGRFSSSKINLQNIKSDKEDTPLKYRDCFISEEGWKIVGADMSQEEYRVAGAVSEEDSIIEAYKNGSDMHTQTAAIVYKVPVNEVTKDQRKHAKTVNFSVLYGTSAYGMAMKQKISKEEAQSIIDNFYKGYPKLNSFLIEYKKNVLNKLYAVTLLGRKRFFERPKIFADERDYYKWKSSVEREGGNHVIQGTCGDILKECLVRLHYENPFGKKMKIILTVHDEIELEVKEELAEEAQTFLKRIMEEVEQKYLGELPAKADAYISDKWEH